MEALHVSDSDAIRDLTPLLRHVQEGGEVFIEQGGKCIAILGSAELAAPNGDAEYDAFVNARRDEALADPHPGYTHAEAQSLFSKHRQTAMARELEIAS